MRWNVNPIVAGMAIVVALVLAVAMTVRTAQAQAPRAWSGWQTVNGHQDPGEWLYMGCHEGNRLYLTPKSLAVVPGGCAK